MRWVGGNTQGCKALQEGERSVCKGLQGRKAGLPVLSAARTAPTTYYRLPTTHYSLLIAHRSRQLLELSLHHEAVISSGRGCGEQQPHIRDHAQASGEVELATGHAAVGQHLLLEARGDN